MKSNLAQVQSNDNQQDFLPGDCVVLTDRCRNYTSAEIFEVKGNALIGGWVIRSQHDLVLVGKDEIRTATVAELHAKRRLTKVEQALAEVS